MRAMKDVKSTEITVKAPNPLMEDVAMTEETKTPRFEDVSLDFGTSVFLGGMTILAVVGAYMLWKKVSSQYPSVDRGTDSGIMARFIEEEMKR